MQAVQSTSADAIHSASAQRGQQAANTSGITLKEGTTSTIHVGNYDIESTVYPPSRVVNPEKTVHIYLAAGGQGLGHRVPMEAALHQLRQMPDTMVTYDKNPPVHTFQRTDVDHARYKLSNWGPMGRLANAYREKKSATAQFEAFKQRITDVTTNSESPVHAAMFNHRFGSVAAAAALPQNVPMLQHIPDHGKPHIGWYNSRMLRLTTTRNNVLDRFLAVNDTSVNHARKHGVQAAHIQRVGYPVHSDYEYWGSQDKGVAREHLGIPPGKRVLLMSAGNARDVGAFVDQVRGLLTHPDAANLHLIPLCASNTVLMDALNGLQTELTAKGLPHIIHPRGMQSSSEMAPLLRAADLNAIQPGGGSLSDCFAMGVVPIIWGEKSGIEHSNRKYAQRNGLALMGFKPQSVGTVFKSTEALTAQNAQMFKAAVFDTPRERLDQILANQAPVQRDILTGATTIAQVVHTIANVQAGFVDKNAAALSLNRPTGATPGTPFSATGGDFTPGSAVNSPT